MRVLVIGGTGFIGSHVVRHLHEGGHEISVFHRGMHHGDLPQPVRHVLGDRQHLLDFRDEFRHWQPAVVLDTCAMTREQAHLAVKTWRGMGTRVVVLSSGDVYRAYEIFLDRESSELEPVPLSEESPLRKKRYPYRGSTPRGPDDPQRWIDDYEKLDVEEVLRRDARVNCTILRLPMVYGPGDGQHRVGVYLRQMDGGQSTIAIAESQASWRCTRGYVENVADAIVLAVTDQRSAGRTYNLGESQALSEVQWINRIAQAAGWPGHVNVTQSEVANAGSVNFEQHLVMHTSRLRRELGYQERVSCAEALLRAVDWEGSHPLQSPPVEAH